MIVVAAAPKLGKSAVSAILLIQLNVGAADVTQEPVKQAKLASVGGDAGIVVKVNGLPDGELEHAAEAEAGSDVCNTEPEGTAV